jgi:predicted lipoprotein with Yx(FWY)xxD motif
MTQAKVDTAIDSKFLPINMEVTATNKEKKVREAVGSVLIYLPLLASFGVSATQAVDSKTNEPLVDDDGIPVYTDDNANWLQKAIYTQVKAQARNRLAPASVDLKNKDLAIATNFAMLTADNLGGGTGKGLEIMREVKALFNTYVEGLKKSKAAEQLIIGLFAKKDNLRVQDSSTKAKMNTYITEFAATLSPEQISKYEKFITEMIDITEETADLNDF